MSPARSNLRLPPLPSDEEILRTLVALDEERWRDFGATANQVAARLGVVGARRLGRGAVKGSWSGTMSPSLRIAPRLRSLAARGLVESYWDDRRRYYVTKAGLRLLGVTRAA